MGTTQSYLSPEVLVTAAVVAGAVGFGYNQVASSSGSPPSTTSAPTDNAIGGGKKGKKKASVAGATKAPDSQISVVQFPAVVPGQFDNEASDSSPAGLEVSTSSSKSKKGKKKKKSGKVVGVEDNLDTSGKDSPVEEVVVSPAAAVTLADSNPNPKKKKRQTTSQNVGKPSAGTAPAPPKADSSARKLDKSTASLASLATESDGEWTRVSRRVDKPGTSSAAGAVSDVGHTTTTGTSSPIDTRTEEGEEEEEEEEVLMSGPGERHPLAKRILPKPRKTGVEDMLATSDYPSYSRVMRVQPGDKPAAGFSWGDYEDVAGGDGAGGELDGDGGADADGEDDGWGVVKRGGRPKNTATSSSQTSLSGSKTASAPETVTKRQRQNAAKRDALKSAKLDAERERLAALAKHKRELERTKIDEQYAKGGSRKVTSGGMQAGVDEKGKLVWE